MTHKKHPSSRSQIGRRGSVIAGGLLLAAYGWLNWKAGIQGGLNFLRMPVFTAGVIVVGLAIVLLALIPSSWVGRVLRIKSKTPTHSAAIPHRRHVS